MEQKVKLHLGCGTVYLKDFTNIDIEAEGHYLAINRPDLVELNQTTTELYYKNIVTRREIERKKLQNNPVVVDLFADVRDLPFAENGIDEIWAVQLFEHFGYEDGERLLKHWRSLLKEDGQLFLDVPDLEGSSLMFNTAKTLDDKKWAARLLYGSQKNEFGYHKGMYDEEMLNELLKRVGFREFETDYRIKHFYPTLQVTAKV